MKVRVRTLGNEEVEIEAQPEKGEKVSSLKEKIEQQWTHMPATRQRLVHAGKVLGDAQLLSDTSIKEGDRLVVMLTKAAAAGAASSTGGVSTSSSGSSSTAAAGGTQSAAAALESDCSSTVSTVSGSASAAAASSSAPAAKEDQASGRAEGEGTAAAGGAAASGGAAGDAANRDAAATTSDSSSAHTAAESVLQTGVQLEETLEQLVVMGFPRQSAEQAMRAAFNNPDRAVEYLMNGLPENVSALLGGGVGLPGGGDADADAAAAAVAAAEELQQEGGEEEGGAAAEEDEAAADTSNNPLAALRRHPAFNQIRQMVQLITQNQDAFLEVLQQEDAAGTAAAQQQGNLADPASGVIQITRDEMEALQRLEALGFTRHQAVEAYLACDRNEEMAANFLLENINDLDGDGAAGGSGAAE